MWSWGIAISITKSSSTQDILVQLEIEWSTTDYIYSE